MSRLSMRDDQSEEDPDSGRGSSRMSSAPTPLPDEGHLDHMLQFIDATIISEHLERTFGVSESLSSWWNCYSHSVQFTHFWLSEMKEEARNGLIHLEMGIVKDQLSLAFAVGRESGDVAQDDVTSFFKAVIGEYPRRLCSADNARYRFLDILFCMCSPEKCESYRKLLTGVRCSTSNKQYTHWLLASRAFALISLCDAVVRFFCEATPSVPVRPKTARGRRPKSPAVLSPTRPTTPSDGLGNPRHYTESGRNLRRKDEETRSTSTLGLDRTAMSPTRPVSSMSTGSDGVSPSDRQKACAVTNGQRAFQAVQMESVETLKYLLYSKRVEVTVTDSQHRTLIVAAVVSCQPHVLTHLLTVSGGPNVNRPATSGNTPLHIAARQGSVEMVQDLILAGADVNCWNAEAEGATPLHLAVMHGMILCKFMGQTSVRYLGLLVWRGVATIPLQMNFVVAEFWIQGTFVSLYSVLRMLKQSANSIGGNHSDDFQLPADTVGLTLSRMILQLCLSKLQDFNVRPHSKDSF